MLLYLYFARRGRRKEKALESQHKAPSNGDAPRLLMSDHPDTSGDKGPTSPTSPTDGLQSPGATSSHIRIGPVAGLTPLDSHASSTSSTLHHKEHPDVSERWLDIFDAQTDYRQVERRAGHKYTIRRPRALQYTYHSKIVIADDEAEVLSPSNSHGRVEESNISSHLPEAVAKSRERLDLFVDLIWVGIIGNLSEVFSSLNFGSEDSRPGVATLVFMLVFLPSWRIWNAMREFLNNYYMEDMLQRLFQLWVLVCSVFYGNQLAYLAEDIDNVKVWVISTYLVIISSFILIELVYSIFIPWLRRLCIFQLVIRVPEIGLWIAAIYVPGIRAVAPIVAAILWEYARALIMDMPFAQRFTTSAYRKALDVNHFQARMANFFIIVLGEGVLQLVKDGPLGRGLNSTTGSMAWVLLIYFAFSYLYFVRDGSKNFIPAVRHRGWKFLVFVFWHIPLFASLLSFVAGVMFIIRHQSEANYEQGQERLTEDEVRVYTSNAIWTCSTSLAIIIFSMLVLALLDTPLDKPGTLRVDNRYIRLAGRVFYIIVILCVPATPSIGVQLFLGIAGCMLVLLMLYEWNTCLEKEGGFIEPRGLTLTMHHEMKGENQVAVAHGDAEYHPSRKFEFTGPLTRV